MSENRLAELAVPAVTLLIAFLSYASQGLFQFLKPGPLNSEQKWIFNILVACLWICYIRAVLVDPGEVPSDWSSDNDEVDGQDDKVIRQRFCRKCHAVKPPRSHHCKICRRCVPKMDHHCPWTGNCVSHFTFPHFMRFLFYAVTAMAYLERLLYDRGAVVWQDRNLRFDLGPSKKQFTLLFILIFVNTITLILVSIIFFRTFYTLGCNVTTIESWEIERHEQLLRRARAFGGYLDGPDGMRIRITRQEFPYDIGVWRNICQGMGTSNFLAWLWPFSRTPRSSGLVFETNGFEDPGTSWPPPDPDRMPRKQRHSAASEAFIYQHHDLSGRQEVEAFKRRQQEDFQRRAANGYSLKTQIFHERFHPESHEPVGDGVLVARTASSRGEEGWQDSGGNRLKDYGVDEDIEFYDEDDVPLAELLRRKQQLSG